MRSTEHSQAAWATERNWRGLRLKHENTMLRDGGHPRSEVVAGGGREREWSCMLQPRRASEVPLNSMVVQMRRRWLSQAVGHADWSHLRMLVQVHGMESAVGLLR